MDKLFYFYVGPTVTDICAKFHVNVIIYHIVTIVFSKRLKVIFLIFTMSEFVKQRSAIKFCLRNEISVAEPFRMLQKAFGDLIMSHTIGISRESLNTVSKDILADNSRFLHHNIAPSHTALVLRDHFDKNSAHIVPQPPYSPDLAPCDFWLFPKLKRPLRGHRFNTIEGIQAESKKALKAITEIEFNKCFDDWKKRWRKCIVSGGDYFGGDEIDLDE